MLLIDSNPHRRARMAEALRSAGRSVVAVGCLAEIEQWPTGDVVVTEPVYCSPWWQHIGASAVVVLADTPGDGVEASGSTAWIPRDGPVVALLALLDSVGGHAESARHTHN